MADLLNHLCHVLLDAAVPASTAEASLSSNAVSRVRALKQHEAAHKAVLPQAQIQSKHELSQYQ